MKKYVAHVMMAVWNAMSQTIVETSRSEPDDYEDESKFAELGSDIQTEMIKFTLSQDSIHYDDKQINSSIGIEQLIDKISFAIDEIPAETKSYFFIDPFGNFESLVSLKCGQTGLIHWAHIEKYSGGYIKIEPLYDYVHGEIKRILNFAQGVRMDLDERLVKELTDMLVTGRFHPESSTGVEEYLKDLADHNSTFSADIAAKTKEFVIEKIRIVHTPHSW